MFGEPLRRRNFLADIRGGSCNNAQRISCVGVQLIDVDPAELSLPACPLPRPGEEVRFFAEARRVDGRLTGHNAAGEAVIRNQFGNDMVKPFEEIRLVDPFKRMPPNWHDLPPGGRLLTAPQKLVDLLDQVLNEKIPPGPSYLDLITEIWSRGFEVFIVGGTVRDALAGLKPNDIDLVTTMPISLVRKFLKSMYRVEPTSKDENGFVRIGGTPKSGDPFIDLKVFSDSLPGTDFAKFGMGFESDFKHRDFACNAVYYDAINKVIIDPSGRGVDDCRNKILSLVCGTENPFQMGQIFIRAVKFVNRGFQLTEESNTRLCGSFRPCLGVMKAELRTRYFVTQVTSKFASPVDKRQAIALFKAQLAAMGMSEVWDMYFAARVDGMFDDE